VRRGKAALSSGCKGRLWGEALEADGMCSERGIEGDGALLGERRSGAVVDGGRSHQAHTAVAMFAIVPVEEVPAVSTGVLDRAETIGEVTVLQGFELRLGVWIVIRDMRAAVGLGNIEVNEERGDRLRSHAGTAIGMERKGPEGNVFLFQGVGDELLGEFCGLSMSEQPTDDVAAVDVEDHVEMEARPFGRALQFGDIPGPHFVGPDRQELGLGVERMNSLTAALASLMLRTVIAAFIEQRGEDRGRCHVRKALAVEKSQQ
jgi:hypothetical protein